MKFSMEKMYVPVASVNEKRDMMNDWRNTSNNVRNFSLIATAVTGFVAMLLRSYNEEFFYIFAAGAVIFLLSAYLAYKWSHFGYTGVIIATGLCFVRTTVPLPDEFLALTATLVGIFIGVLPCFFAFRCLYNYNEVFLELKKFKEFPDFIQNTADLYGEKIYLNDKDDNAYDNKFEASYNPFNTQADVYREEFLRAQQVKGQKRAGKKVMDIDIHKDNVRNRADVKKSKTFFGYEWFMFSGDLLVATRTDKKLIADKWRENNALAEMKYSNIVMCLAFCIMIGGFGSLAGMLNYLALIVFTLGITGMKLNNPVAPVVVIGSLVYVGAMTRDIIGLLFFVMALYQCRWLALSIVRFYLNYRTYRELKGMPGFPSFISTTTDLYGDKLYIVEEQKPIVKNMNNKPKIVMDIGYNEPEKKEDKGWNAFDYMDEENKND